jgi:Fe-S-cluster containining protein
VTAPEAPPPAPDVARDGDRRDAARRLLRAHPDPPRRSAPVRALRRLGRELVAIPLAVLDLGRRFGAWAFRSEYVLEGACHQRGACCHHILLEWSPWLDRFPLLGRIVLWKYTRFYSFYDRGYTWELEQGVLARVMSCHALQPDGRCGEHRIRPSVCRSYPETPILGRPHLLNGCGFRVVRRDGQPEPEDEAAELVQLRRRLPPS